MKKILLFLLISTTMNAQIETSEQQNSEIVSTEAGIIIPFGQLANKFKIAQCYGIWIKIGKDYGWAANVGVNLIVLKDARPIDYKFNNVCYKINSNKLGFDLGIKAAKTIKISKKNYFEFDSMLGFHYLDYDFPKRKDKNNEDKNGPFQNMTFILAPSMKFMINNFGFKFQYRLTPFDIIEEIESNFGSHSIGFGIVYKQ